MDNFSSWWIRRRRRIGSLRTLVFMFQNNSPSYTLLHLPFFQNYLNDILEFLFARVASLSLFFISKFQFFLPPFLKLCLASPFVPKSSLLPLDLSIFLVLYCLKPIPLFRVSRNRIVSLSLDRLIYCSLNLSLNLSIYLLLLRNHRFCFYFNSFLFLLLNFSQPRFLSNSHSLSSLVFSKYLSFPSSSCIFYLLSPLFLPFFLSFPLTLPRDIALSHSLDSPLSISTTQRDLFISFSHLSLFRFHLPLLPLPPQSSLPLPHDLSSSFWRSSSLSLPLSLMNLIWGYFWSLF